MPQFFSQQDSGPWHSGITKLPTRQDTGISQLQIEHSQAMLEKQE